MTACLSFSLSPSTFHLSPRSREVRSRVVCRSRARYEEEEIEEEVEEEVGEKEEEERLSYN